MDWLLRFVALIVIAVGLGFSALLLSRRRFEKHSKSTSDGFRPKIGFTHLDGMASPALLLSNNGKRPVWVEEIEISLADLIADEEEADPPCMGTLKIRQTVRPHDMLPISLAASVYKAAGEPQHNYSCVLSSIVRYRIGEDWLEKELEVYRIGMLGLIAVKVRRERGFVPQPRIRDKSRDVREPAAVK